MLVLREPGSGAAVLEVLDALSDSYRENSQMLFGDAKERVEDIIRAL